MSEFVSYEVVQFEFHLSSAFRSNSSTLAYYFALRGPKKNHYGVQLKLHSYAEREREIN
jgi:hypothetical protein